MINSFSAMILAAGYGKRLLPLTLNLPKPLIKIKDITLLDNMINFLKSLGCKQIIINTHYKHEKIAEVIRKNNFMNYFYSHSHQPISLKEFKLKYHLLNCSRQTRLLGRWVKLANELNQLWYLDFISTTKLRLQSSLAILQNNKLTKFYDKYIL